MNSSLALLLVYSSTVTAHTLESGQRLVKLRKYWGKVRKGIWEGVWSDGSKEWITGVQEEMDHNFGSDSVFWISYEDLIRISCHFDCSQLSRYRDPCVNNADKRKQRRAEWEVEQKRLNKEFNAKVKAEDEKAAEAKNRAQEADDKALSKRTKEIKISEDKDEPVVDEHRKGHGG
ncbi:Uncharacterized protein LW94_14753 [Fusarium fujikuroi]|nr:Uncharacterized protein LW94_14753 [Fusarium fujikuroi]